MIETDLVTYLLTDTTLKTLLGSAADPKIYPITAIPKVTIPYILYDWELETPIDELLEEDRVELNIVGKNYGNLIEIRNRLEDLLNLKDKIQSTAFTSSRYRIFWSDFSDGRNNKQNETQKNNMVVFVNVKYIKR